MPTQKIYIYSAKDISHNRRIPLMASFFADLECDVTVLTYNSPPLYYNDNRVTFLELGSPVFMNRLLAWVETSESREGDFFRHRTRGRIYSFVVGSIEAVKYSLRKPITACLVRLFKKRLSSVSIDYAKNISINI